MSLITKVTVDLSHLEDENTGKQPFPEPITFIAGAYLEKSHQETLTKFWAMTKEQQKTVEYETNAEVLIGLARFDENNPEKHVPVGIPGFVPGSDYRDALKAYFAERTDAKELLLQALINAHIVKAKSYSFR